jgi:hypothetical protein
LRKGGNHYDNNIFTPAFRILTGVELGFDKFEYSKFLGSLILEIRYSYMFRNIDIFSKIKNQFRVYPDSWNHSFSIAPGNLELNLGISFNFNPKIKKRMKEASQ